MAQVIFLILLVIVVMGVQAVIVRWVFRIDEMVGHLERINESLSILVGQQRQAGPAERSISAIRIDKKPDLKCILLKSIMFL
ncbi:MAG: hypothetical protein ACYS8I_09780 [Planctomycetota bacterium]|jgi:hypothetical protein